MPQTLTFALETLDRPLDDHLRQELQNGLMRQLAGLTVEPAAVHTQFHVNLGDGTSIRLRLTGVSGMPHSGEADRVIIVDPYRHDEVPEDGRHGLEGFPQAPQYGRPLPVPGDLSEYVGTATIWSAGPEGPDPAVAAGFDRLIGIPKYEVLADVVARLQPHGQLLEWSRRHYGRVIRAAHETVSSVPCLLLAGDPGTGKSALAHGLAAMAAGELREEVAFIQLNQRLRGYGIQGRAGSDVVGFLTGLTKLAAASHLPLIVFLDEAEAVGGIRSARDASSGALENTAVVDALIVGLDSIRAQGAARLVFLMATNLIERVDPALRRRATVYSFERPSARDRYVLLESVLSDALDQRALAALNQALERDEGPALTAADIVHQVITRAVREATGGRRPLDPVRMVELAQQASATRSVSRP